MTKITIFCKGVIVGGVSDAMKRYAGSKLDFREVDSIKLFLEGNGNGYLLSAKFEDFKNRHYYLTADKNDFYECVDKLSDMIFIALNRKKNFGRVNNQIVPEEDPEDSQVVKIKHLIASQISENQAIDEMNELGHSWYVFRNDENDIAVIYKRYDGNYGLMIVK